MKKPIILLLILFFMPFVILGQDYYQYPPYESGYIPIELNGKYGLKNTKNEIIIPLIYDEVSDISEGLFKIVLNDKVGFIDLNGKVVIPLIYDIDNENIIGQTLYRQIEQDKNGEVSKETLLVSIDSEYVNFSEGLCAVVKNKKYGFIDKNNKIIIPLIYEAADNFHEEFAIIKLKGKYGLIDKNGNIVLENKYDSLIWDKGFTLLLASQNDDFFYIEKDLKTIKKVF